MYGWRNAKRMGIGEESNALDDDKEDIMYPSKTPLFKKSFPFDIIALHCCENNNALVLDDNKFN